jgi:glycerophosphoryl diester phosphodiesterase
MGLRLNQGFRPSSRGGLRLAGRRARIIDLPTSGLVSYHRGSGVARPIAPENSLSSYQLAISMGAHILDVDYQAAGDGTLVVLHDTTVDRTTAATGDISTFTAATLPNISMPEVVGVGWPAEPMPTVDQLLRALGGKAVLTIETKGGTPGVAPLAALIKQYGLQDSVFINTSSSATTAAIVAAGCYAHQYGVTDSAGVTAAAAAGAWMIELPYNASSALVSQALSSGIKRVVAAPISKRSEFAGMTPGLHGVVTDAPGYAERTTRYANSIGSAARAGKRPVGTFIVNGTGTRPDLYVSNAGLVLIDSAARVNTHAIGAIAGPVGTTGTITFKFKVPTLPAATSQRNYARVLCPQEQATAGDADTQGYVISLRCNGQLNLWESPQAFGGGVPLGATPIGAPLVAGTEYTLTFEWTATQVRLTRADTGDTTGWVNSTAWRGPYHYVGTTQGSGEAVVTELAIS